MRSRHDDFGAIYGHLEGDTIFILSYVEVIRDTLVEADPANADILTQTTTPSLPAIYGSSFTPSQVIEQISREANVQIYMIDDEDLPGEPGDLARSYTTLRARNIEIPAEALGGDGSHAVHIEARNIPGAKWRNSAKKGLDDRIGGELEVDQSCRHDHNAGTTDSEKRRQNTGNPIDTAVRVCCPSPC